jgi:DNA-binding CsgD family transcriptional regulator
VFAAGIDVVLGSLEDIVGSSDLAFVLDLIERMPIRDRTILALAAEGKTDKIIATELDISPVTVNSRWRRILIRFKAASRTEVVAKVIAAMAMRDHSSKLSPLQNQEGSLSLERDGWQRTILERISKTCLEALWNRKDIRDVFEDLLAHTLIATESEFGFMGEVLTDELGKPYISTFAVTNISWDAETRALYDREHEKGLTFRNLDSLFGHVLVTGKTYISNQPSTDPRRAGLPKGHPPLKSFVGVPLKAEGELFGIVGLANRPGGYTEAQLAAFEPIFAMVATMMVAARAEYERARAQQQTVLMRSIWESLVVGVLHEDENRLITYVNPAFCSIFGLPNSALLVGYDYSEQLDRTKHLFKDPARALDRVNATIARGWDVVGEQVEFADGRVFHRDFSRLFVDGAMRGYVWTYREMRP